MAQVSKRYLELAAAAKSELDAVFAAGSPPDVSALTGFEFRGFNQPRVATALGIRKFIKCFYLDREQVPFGCNTPVVQNNLDEEWVPRPRPERPKRYAFFSVEAADPGAPDPLLQRAVLLDYRRGSHHAYEVTRILRDYLVRIDDGSDDLLLGKALFVVGGRRLAQSYFLLERSRPLPDAADLARR